MKVGVIGTHWGRVHVGAFRAHGHEVAVLLGRDLAETERVARAEGIPRATLDPEDLREVDVVVVASPTSTHRSYIERFWDRPVLCEKPLCGTVPDPLFLERLEAAPVYVNYAFSFLDTARLARHHIQAGSLGEVFRIVARVSFRFPGQRSAADWLLDIASHPLSFLNLAFGPFTLLQFHCPEGRANVSALFTNGRQLLDLSFYEAPSESIGIDLTIVGERAEMRLEGGYRPGRGWGFEPLRIEGVPQNEGERSGPEDIWYRANVRCVGAFLDVIQGRRSRLEARADGLSDAATAAWIERGLAPLLTASEGERLERPREA